jgi:hypothetical protein
MVAKFAVRTGRETLWRGHLDKVAMRFGSPTASLPDHKKCNDNAEARPAALWVVEEDERFRGGGRDTVSRRHASEGRWERPDAPVSERDVTNNARREEQAHRKHCIKYRQRRVA